MTGDPDRPPARVALAVTDEHTAVFAAFGALMAILQRQKTGKGQIVDSTLYESAFSMMEPHVPAYDRLKIIPKRVGSNLPSTAPNSLYPTKDGSFVLIAANNDVIFKRLAQAMDQPELRTDERFATQRARAARVKEVNKIVEDWAAHYSAAEIETRLIAAEVPVSKVFTIEDIFHDPHFKQREMLVQVPHPEFGELTLMGVVPKLSDTPGKIRHAGHKVGQDTTEVLQKKLGLNVDELSELLKQGVIHAQS